MPYIESLSHQKQKGEETDSTESCRNISGIGIISKRLEVWPSPFIEYDGDNTARTCNDKQLAQTARQKQAGYKTPME